MEQRRHPRIQLPLLVELKHPAIGVLRCIARDSSEGGVYVHTDNPQIRPGAKVKLTLQNALGVEAQATPTVEMEVVRVEADGLGLAFTSGTGRHLWQSVERLRTELAIGRDYFQVHVSALVVAPGHGVLLVRQQGPWTLPGTFLVVGENWQRYLQAFLQRELQLSGAEVGNVVAMRNVGSSELPEAATLKLTVEVRADGASCTPAADGRFRAARWVARRVELDNTTLADEGARALAVQALTRIATEGAGGGDG